MLHKLGTCPEAIALGKKPKHRQIVAGSGSSALFAVLVHTVNIDVTAL